MTPVNFFWHRRDLRVEDNHGLYQALRADEPTIPVFIFDRKILDELEDEDDARVTFIHHEIQRLKAQYESKGGTFLVEYGEPEEIWAKWLNEYPVAKVYTNEDYEPYARERDQAIAQLCSENEVSFQAYKDHVIFEKDEVVKDDGKPYVVYTPYSKLWKKQLTGGHLGGYPSEDHLDGLANMKSSSLPSLSHMGFKQSSLPIPSRELDEHIVEHYAETRDLPAKRGTTRMSIHLRFGTISIRQLAQRSNALSEKYLNELIWRDFYQAIIYHFPRVVGNAFRPEYDYIQWENNEEHFQKWCDGNTGYPIVDAGMRELNTTGFMHNRVRMIVASFLTKHLLIDWRWGEAYFARKLLDFELASNNGGWQWAAGSGVDAAPYFRVFNPELQMKKFDPKLAYVKQWVPEFQELNYKPIVEHKMARERAISRYKEGIERGRAKL